MFSRNPSRRVTGAEEPPELVVEFDVPEELDELHPAAASSIAAPAPAAISVFLIVRLFSWFFFDQNYRLSRQPFIPQTPSGHHAGTLVGTHTRLPARSLRQLPAAPESSGSIPATDENRCRHCCSWARLASVALLVW